MNDEQTPARRCLDGIARLAELEKRGMDDSPEADAIRDEMDEPWAAMTDDERKTAADFSVSLRHRDELDWRTEGTKANLRVEYLMAKTIRWGIITEVMITAALAVLLLNIFLDLIKSHELMLWAWTGQWALTVACYVRHEVLRIELKALTEDE